MQRVSHLCVLGFYFMKICNECKINKPDEDFYKSQKYTCSSCLKKRKKAWYRTESGVLKTIYNSMKQSSIKRKHDPPNFSFNDFKNWMYNNGFRFFYSIWINIDYNKNEKPSCDRLNDSKPYTLDNIKLTQWVNNKDHQFQDVMNGNLVVGIKHTPVIAINIKTGKQQIFISQADAARKLNCSQGHIGSVCRNKRKSHKGYIFKYK